MKTKRFRTKYPLADVVRENTVEELRRFCSRHTINVKKSCRKEVLVQAVANYVLENTETILSGLMIWDLEIVRDLVSIGPGKGLAAEPGAISYAQISLFLLNAYDGKPGSRWFIMSDDLREAIGSKAEELLADEDYRKKSEMLQFLQGLKNIYGTVYTWDARDDFERCYPEYKGNNEIWRELMSSPNTLEDIEIYRSDHNKGFLLSPMIDYLHPDVLDVLPTYEQQENSRKIFSRQEIIEAGNMPYPIFSCEAALRLKEHLRKEWEVNEPAYLENLLYFIFLEGQIVYNKPDKASQLADGYETNDPKAKDKLIELIDNFVNSTPCWALNGHSVYEVETVQEES